MLSEGKKRKKERGAKLNEVWLSVFILVQKVGLSLEIHWCDWPGKHLKSGIGNYVGAAVKRKKNL